MVTTWMIRVDIDTLEGLKKGVPILLKLSKKYNIKMTFFFPFGGFQTGKNLFKILRSRERIRKIDKKTLSNFEPLQLLKSLLNIEKEPYSLFKQFKDPILSLDNEIALHGYKHYEWLNYLPSYTQKRQEFLLIKGFIEFRETFSFLPKGFAAPGFRVTNFINRKLQQLPLNYCSNYYMRSEVKITDEIIEIPVNFPLIEELLVKGMSTEEILKYYLDLKEKIKSKEGGYILFYIHPLKEPILNFNLLQTIIENFLSDKKLKNQTMIEFSNKILKIE